MECNQPSDANANANANETDATVPEILNDVNETDTTVMINPAILHNDVNVTDVRVMYPEIRQIPLLGENGGVGHNDTVVNKCGSTSEVIQVKVIRQGTDPISFIVRLSTQMSKLMNIYCKEAGFTLHGLRFLFDGKRIQEYDTPKSLELENGDIIEVMQLQTGGNRAWKKGNFELFLSMLQISKSNFVPILFVPQ